MVTSARDFYSWQAPSLREYISGGLLHEKSLAVIFGDQETFKTWLMLDLSFCLSQGRDWLMFPTKKCNVLYLNCELPDVLFHSERFMPMVRSRGTVPKDLYLLNDLTFKIDTEMGLAKLRHWCQSYNIHVVILDNLYRSFSQDLNVGTSMSKFLDNVAYIRTELGTSFFVVHHTRKHQWDIRTNKFVRTGPEDMTGSKYLLDNATTILESRKVEVLNGVSMAPGVELHASKLTYSKSTRSGDVLGTYEVRTNGKFLLV